MKKLSPNFISLFHLLFFSSLCLIITTKEEKGKSIFDETYLKHLKLKNRIFRAAIGDLFMKNGKITEEGFKYIMIYQKMK